MIPNQNSAPLQLATANGVPYTQYDVTPPGSGDLAYVLVPDVLEEGGAARAVMSYHGRSGSRNSINGDNIIGVRDALLDDGFVLLSPQMHGDQWGNATAQNDAEVLYSWASSIWTLTRIYLYAFSMGGNAAALSLARGVIPYSSTIMLAPSLNLRAAWDRADAAQPTIRTAFGITADGSDYAEKTAGWDGILRPPSEFAGERVLIYASAGDTTVDREVNADQFASQVEGIATCTVVSVTGGHLSTSHYKPAEAVAFFQDVEVPPVGDSFLVESAYLCGPGRSRYALTL